MQLMSMLRADNLKSDKWVFVTITNMRV